MKQTAWSHALRKAAVDVNMVKPVLVKDEIGSLSWNFLKEKSL